MAYDDIKVTFGRTPVYILELDLDYCVNDYGVAPCTASGPVSLKCHNTFATCQDTANFNLTTRTYRFASQRIDELQQAGDPPTFPVLKTVNTTPTKLEPGKGLGVRSTVKVSLIDFPWTDIGTDPYISERVSPLGDDSGTFWGRFLARNPYYEGRVMRVIQGYLEEDGSYSASNTRSRSYIIYRISGPNPNGTVTIEGKDPLKFADSERAQWPAATSAELTTGITSGQTSFNIIDEDGDILAEWASGQRYIRIDDEVMELTGVSAIGVGAYTLSVTRATLPSIYTVSPTAAAHDAGATVQPCYFFEAQRVDNIIYFLLNYVAGISSSFLPLAEWASVIEAGLQSYTFSTLLVDPTGVKDLLTELTEHTILLWWDERDQEVKLDTIINLKKNAGPYNDSENIIAGSVQVTKDVKSRLSEVWMFFGQRTPLEDLDKISNYQRVEVKIDTDSESSLQYGDKRVKKIYSRWLQLDLRAVASEISNRLLNQYKEVKDVISMAFDPKDDDQWTGDRITLETRYVQDSFGQPKTQGYRILQVDEMLTLEGVRFKYVMQSERALFRTGLITPDIDPENPPAAFPNYTPASDALKDRYAFIAPNTGVFADGEPAYTIV